MTGAELAACTSPALRVGIILAYPYQDEANELVRVLAAAAADYVIPPAAARYLGLAVGFLVMLEIDEDACQANEILTKARDRRKTPEFVTELAVVAAQVGVEQARYVLEEMLIVGEAVYGALGDRPVQPAARDLLASFVAEVADHKWA